VILIRGLTEDNSFETLIKDTRSGKVGDTRKNGAIVVFDSEGKPFKRYKLTNCWPKSLEIATLKAGDTSVLTEKLTVTYESMEPE
jgi:phage tail-like protein